MVNNLITAVFTVFWIVMAGIALSKGDWFYGGLDASFVLWNGSYLYDKIFKDRK